MASSRVARLVGLMAAGDDAIWGSCSVSNVHGGSDSIYFEVGRIVLLHGRTVTFGGDNDNVHAVLQVSFVNPHTDDIYTRKLEVR